MNYPVWELQSSGLLIAIVAILHVFVSHFAVGGGLFLVLTERKARREQDAALLGYVEKHSRFFALLTLVFGAISGVGIWFTITLVHPAATSSLINTFVWGWAIEWTFFLTEVAAAIIYYYGWKRLAPRTHLIVGWIYFVAAWLSLVVINGILSYMLTPGRWLETRGFWDGFFNPTYWSSTVARTLGSVGLAGLYALFTASTLEDAALKRKVARWAGLRWVVPMALLLPLSLAWYFQAAGAAGVPLGEIFGNHATGVGAVLQAAWHGVADQGYPVAQRASRIALLGMTLAFLATLFVVFVRRERYGRVSAVVLLVCGLLSIGGAEWVREGLRKPFVIGNYMYVTGVRLPAPQSVPQPPAEVGADPFTPEALARTGVLAASPWVRWPVGSSPGTLLPADVDVPTRIAVEAALGREVYTLECAVCHSMDHYLAIRPLVRGKSSATLAGLFGQLDTWRGRRMPPFVGTEEEARALSVYLATVGGGEVSPPPAPATGARSGAQQFEDGCAMCHAAGGDWPISRYLKGRAAPEFYELLGRLPEINAQMPPYEGGETERRALAEYLAGLGSPVPAP